MKISLYDSKTKSNKNLTLKDVSIYNCGPTVYNDLHIGNIRPIITFDVLLRLLKAQKYNVKMLSNITDIDDKIINRAQSENKTEKQITSFYLKEYLKLLKRFNVLNFNKQLVSSEIKQIINYIQKLIDKGNAYVVNGNVYFSINSIKNYGKLSNKKINELLDGVRKENSLDKKNPLDFTLWKKTTIGLKWKSPWSNGRPGWHTECAVLINKKIGDQVTIHGGGIDLKFPHHENENIQNKAITGKELARIWMHVGHVNIDNQKMSKSLNNFILAKDLLNKYDSNIIRWMFYQTKYQNPINFSYERLEESKRDLQKIIHSINIAKSTLYMSGNYTETIIIDKEMINVLSNDLDFPNSIKRIWTLTKQLNESVRSKKISLIKEQLSNLLFDLNLLGINIKNQHSKSAINEIKKWSLLMKQKEYKQADKIRNKLLLKNLI